MRRIFTTADAYARGLTRSALRAGEKAGRWRKLGRGVYGEGPDGPRALDVARAAVHASGGVASGRLAGVLLGNEHVVVVHGTRCTDGVTTLRVLAALVDDVIWEQALESAHRKRLVTDDDIEVLRSFGSRSRTDAARRIRRVMARRPPGTPPTGSLLETLMLQLVRAVPGLGEPVWQYKVRDERRTTSSHVNRPGNRTPPAGWLGCSRRPSDARWRGRVGL